jgi:hypothetical protein
MVPAIQLKERPESKGDYLQAARNLNRRWRTLCDRYLPLASEKSIWRFSRLHSPQDQEQGWKIHIAATVLSAGDILERIGPLLSEARYLFKGAASLQELAKINSGLFYGFSQVGKCITVYPNSREDAVELAAKLYTMLSGLPGPAVPYDKPYREGAPLYYRYGAFGSLGIENVDGTRTSAIRNHRNEVVPDRREPGAAVPEWETDPFAAGEFTRRQLLDPAIKPYESLSQRGKGGVYKALDLSVTPARVCILKEGRRHGETDWGGRDGYWRISHEESVLRSLRLAGIDVPRVYRSFSVPGNYYLAMEFIEGQSLQSLVNNPRKKMLVAEALRYGAHLAELVHAIHSAGWVWRDCKPLNVIVTSDCRLRPLDFEGACRIDEPDSMPWGTPGYISPEADKGPVSGSRAAEDLHALGASLYQLFTGKIPDGMKVAPIGKYRRRLQRSVREAVTALLDPDPCSRPKTLAVAQILRDAAAPARSRLAA